MPLARIIILAVSFTVVTCLCVSLILVSIRYREDSVDTPAREVRPKAQAVYSRRRHRMRLPAHLRSGRVLLGLSLALTTVLVTAGFTGSRAPAPPQSGAASAQVTRLTVTATETASAYTLAPAALTAASTIAINM